MHPPSSTPFGKRNRPALPRATAAAATLVPQAALFAEIRAEAEAVETRPLVVPRSFRAAILAGLVVGCCLAGLDATRAGDMLRDLPGAAVGASPLGDPVKLLPVFLILGLLGGARAAATNLLVAHWLLRRAGWTHHLAYALAGAIVAAGVAGLAQAIAFTGLMDSAGLRGHGLLLDMAAGAGAGFFYRVFAGAASV